MRSAIARRLGESYREAVHVTEHRTVDAEALFDARDVARSALDADVSVTDLLTVALSAALEAHPEFNATYEDGVHRIYEEQNVCLAVDVEAGLVAPALRDVGEKSLETLAEERAALTERTLAGDYTSDDLSGGTFTVSNLGVLGVESFDPIINPPQVAILGVNAVDERPVARDGEVVVRRRLPLDLSFDHRVVDGADAARFMSALVERLEEPWPLLPAAVERPPRDLDLPERDVSASADGTLSGTVSIGSVEWRYDVPADAGGDGTGPTPVGMFLGSLAACLSTTVRMQAERSDVALADVDAHARATPERGWVEAIGVELRLDSDADDGTLDRVVELAERNCYALDALRDDLGVEVEWRRA
jgi:pyruvate dehydrogenase E2 component (dihydrolipoamide acetyltransferase)